MHTYIKSRQEGGNYLYTVGTYDAAADTGYRPEFNPLKDFKEEWYAAVFVNFLNGGRGNCTNLPVAVLKEAFPGINWK